jgi:lipopolysaccharide/colanic/teichoic acid biosynthesis glycosyltransferase
MSVHDRYSTGVTSPPPGILIGRQPTDLTSGSRFGAFVRGRRSQTFAQLNWTAPPVEQISTAWTKLSSGAARINTSLLKRTVDVVGATIGILVLGPFLLLVALLIRLESPGPALFRQRRLGRGGVPFRIYKFRSMTVVEDGPTILQASPGDSRLTRLGSFLRRSCIDEMPQLLNVLKGEMSLVGPRPHAVAHDAFYSQMIPGYEARFLVRPGIAGLAQVSGCRGATPTIESMAVRVALDQEYIAAWSVTMDLRMLARAVTEGPFSPAAY